MNMKKKVLTAMALVAALVLPCLTRADLGPWVIDGSSGLGWPLSSFFEKYGGSEQYGSVINLTQAIKQNESGAFWTKVPLQTKELTYIVGLEVHPRPRSVRSADGFTMVLGTRKGALGEPGEALGFSGQRQGYPPLGRSLAVVFKYFAVRPNQERIERSYSGPFVNGERIPHIPEETNRFVDLTARGIDLANGNFLAISLQYKDGVLTVVIDDLVTGVWVRYFSRVNLPFLLGDFAYIGMTGSTGVETSTIKVHGVGWSDSGDPSVIGMKMAAGKIVEAGQLNFFKQVGAQPRQAAPAEDIWLTGPWSEQ